MNFARRQDLVLQTATPDNIGPNAYNIGECCKYNKKNAAPFLSSSARTKPSKISNAPLYPANDYIRSRIQYGNSLGFTAERKTIVIGKSDHDESKTVRPRNLKPPQSIAQRKGMVAFCRVPYTHGYSAPSMTPKNTNGYDLDANNKLFKNPTIDLHTNVGPTTYNVPQGEYCYTSIRYRGCAWSKSKTKREMANKNNYPGPTHYYPKDPKCVRYRGDFEGRPLMRKCCNVPRYICQISCKSKFEETPAPGTYEIVDLNKIGKVKNLSLTPKPFVNSAARFQYGESGGPGPQTYEVCDCFKLRKDYNIGQAPFLKSDKRFKHETIKLPGPGEYDSKDAEYHKYEKYTKKAPFNSTSKRKLFNVLNTVTPDPASYDVPAAVKCASLQKENRASVFKSMVCRFGRSKDKTDLSPASYNINYPFKYLNGDITRDKPNVYGFNRTEERRDPLPDFAGKFFLYGKDTPGVGRYTLNLDCNCESRGHCFKTSPRYEPDVKLVSPGPNYYQLHPSKTDALWPAKKTHNHRLLNNVIRRNPQMKGPKLNMRSSVKASRKKILRFFLKTGDYKHCW